MVTIRQPLWPYMQPSLGPYMASHMVTIRDIYMLLFSRGGARPSPQNPWVLCESYDIVVSSGCNWFYMGFLSFNGDPSSHERNPTWDIISHGILLQKQSFVKSFLMGNYNTHGTSFHTGSNYKTIFDKIISHGKWPYTRVKVSDIFSELARNS